MKMTEYQDYMRLIFDKYLKKAQYVLLIIGLVGVLIAISQENMSVVEHAISVGIVPLIVIGGYQLLRWVFIYLPAKIFGVVEIVKKDMDEIHQKHNSDQETKSN